MLHKEVVLITAEKIEQQLYVFLLTVMITSVCVCVHHLP